MANATHPPAPPAKGTHLWVWVLAGSGAYCALFIGALAAALGG